MFLCREEQRTEGLGVTMEIETGLCSLQSQRGGMCIQTPGRKSLGRKRDPGLRGCTPEYSMGLHLGAADLESCRSLLAVWILCTTSWTSSYNPKSRGGELSEGRHVTTPTQTSVSDQQVAAIRSGGLFLLPTSSVISLHPVEQRSDAEV